MSLLALFAKVGSLVVVAGAAIATPLALNASKSSKTQEPANQATETSIIDLSAQGTAERGECWEIPTIPKDNSELLICTNKDKYYLYDSSVSGKNEAFTKITKIEGPKNKTITITLEKGEAQTKELVLADNQWNGRPENLDFYNKCNLVSADTGSSMLFCTSTSWSSSITLTSFTLEHSEQRQ
ncbi:hypothetical protein WEN_00195 [Mycoplasma wenyonii str. Massachusetts]|uniref:Uncharacterized protein n=1 Tax=Mycoplasma wenyonii (strain Massachusetts) TaxID=1197325 RepID=I6YA79_MYCWM|nr:hypothetical protein [Mycoplasma wenyonii]AFN64846.1 hypothetical protein WEN_00195 [Mycoplasma wenyonii str. Massachusetts]